MGTSRWDFIEFRIQMKFSSDFDQKYLQELDDHGILILNFKDFDKNYFQELDDHEIFMKFFKDFDPNSDC